MNFVIETTFFGVFNFSSAGSFEGETQSTITIRVDLPHWVVFVSKMAYISPTQTDDIMITGLDFNDCLV